MESKMWYRDGTKVVEFLDYLKEIRDSRLDWIVGTDKIQMLPDATMAIMAPDGQNKILEPTEWAHTQISQYLNIPKNYYDRMLRDDKELLSTNVNRWLRERSEPRMIRAWNGQLLALLSNKYRIIDNYDAANAILRYATNWDNPHNRRILTTHHMYVTMKMMSIEVYSPDIYVTDPDKPDDKYFLGISARNSEVGYTAFVVEPLLVRQICTNGLIAGTSYRQVHIGSAADEGDVWTNNTKTLENMTTISKIKDITEWAFNKDNAQIIVEKLSSKRNEPIKPQWVDRTSSAFGFTDEENKLIWDQIRENNKYDFIQAVTSTANDILQDGSKDPERAIYLQKKAYELMASDEVWKILKE